MSFNLTQLPAAVRLSEIVRCMHEGPTQVAHKRARNKVAATDVEPEIREHILIASFIFARSTVRYAHLALL